MGSERASESERRRGSKVAEEYDSFSKHKYRTSSQHAKQDAATRVHIRSLTVEWLQRPNHALRGQVAHRAASSAHGVIMHTGKHGVAKICDLDVAPRVGDQDIVGFQIQVHPAGLPE